jgi:DNA recombination protein RmuC
MAMMPGFPQLIIYAACVLAGVLLGLLLARIGRSTRLAAAREEGRASGHAARDPEFATLAAQQVALEARRAELSARVERYERDWTAAEQTLRQTTADAARSQADAARMTAELADLRVERDTATSQLRELSARHAAVEAAAREQAQAAAEKLALLERAREDLRTQFKLLSDELLEDKSKRLAAQNNEQMALLLNPLREQIGDFRKLVSESYEKEGHARVALQTEVKQLLALNHRLSDEANSLARALTTENRTQGYWGELRLERLLESSGLEKGREYVTQESFRDAEGDLYRPDAVVRLPEGKDIVIDAKVALLAYRDGCDAVDAEERERCMARHAVAMRGHVRALGDKDYARLNGITAPDLVLMFVPVEAAFLEAMRRDAALYEDAYARKIVIVGPGNLLASLRLIAHLWRTDQQNRNARAIADRAALLYDKFVGFVGDLQKIGKSLDDAQGQYRNALGKLSEGRGNLVRQAEMLRTLGVTPSKQLPPELADGTDHDGEGSENVPSAGDASS